MKNLDFAAMYDQLMPLVTFLRPQTPQGTARQPSPELKCLTAVVIPEYLIPRGKALVVRIRGRQATKEI